MTRYIWPILTGIYSDLSNPYSPNSQGDPVCHDRGISPVYFMPIVLFIPVHLGYYCVVEVLHHLSRCGVLKKIEKQSVIWWKFNLILLVKPYYMVIKG